MRIKKLINVILICVISSLVFIINGYASSIIVKNDLESTYIPTSIINGSFDDEPWMDFKLGAQIYTSCPHTAIVQLADEIYFNGVNEGWNTTETTVWNGNLFEYATSSIPLHNINYNDSINPSQKYVEMNGSYSAILYQDLTTQGDDVILWRLKHGVTTKQAKADAIQNMRVEIGSPNRKDGNIVNAHGINADINPEIVLSTKAIYRSTGVTDSSGNESTLGYAGSDIENLSLSKTANANGWYTASGIYIVPENQNVTRFGFVAEANTPNYGNLLDDIEFSTLIGNLSAVYNDDKSATVRGYWGEIDKTKKLIIKIGEGTYTLDMSDINGNFMFDISKEMIGKETYIEVYHEDFEQVKKSIKIVAGKVTKRTTIEDGNFSIVSTDEQIINSLDEETVNKVKHGEDIDILIDIKNITDTIDTEDKDLFVSNLNKYTLGDIYEVSLYKKLESDEENVKVTNLNEKIDFSIQVPNTLIDKKVNRIYKILNYYDGKVEVLDATFDKETNTLIFKTDKLSKIAIIYNDIGNPKTGDNIVIYTVCGIVSLLGLVGAVIYIKRHR